MLSFRFVVTMSTDNLKYTLRTILEKNKLTQTNFLDWERNLRIIPKSEGQEDVLEKPIPEIAETASEADKQTHKKIADRSRSVTCLMLAATDLGLQ